MNYVFVYKLILKKKLGLLPTVMRVLATKSFLGKQQPNCLLKNADVAENCTKEEESQERKVGE